MRRDDEIFNYNEGRLWATWDHYPIHARILEDVNTNKFTKEERKRRGLVGKRKQKSNHWNSKKVMMKKNKGIEDAVGTVQRTSENAAGKVAHHTNAGREKE